VALSLVGIVGVGLAVAWAAAAVLRPADDPLAAIDHTLVEVVRGEVGSAIHLNTFAAWEPVLIASNRAEGIVTEVHIPPGAEVRQGDLLYEVNERPVTIAEGSVPAYRDVTSGMKGSDVRQLQQLLSDLGWYNGPVVGESGAGTGAAIRAWQRDLGVEATGIVNLGDIMFVPILPSRVALDAGVVHRGAIVVGSEPALSGLPTSPAFTIPVTESQATMMPAGTRVAVSSPAGATWEGFVAEHVREPDSGALSVVLVGAAGAAVCGPDCDEVPVGGSVALASRIVTVEPTKGLVVPSAALISNADGQIAVISANGDALPVEVVVAAQGMSVIEGVEAGTRVRVPATGSR